jgi:hypothetical protein
MQCIFCKNQSDTSKSVEHIIPESLGNTEHILRKGIVCDSCNNYFAVKIEQPLLLLPYFVSLRHRNEIENKKGRIPIDKGILIAPTLGIANFHRGKDGHSISFEDENLIGFLTTNKTFSIVMPFNEKPPDDNIFISKFLGKVGLEALAHIGQGVENGIQELIDKVELDAIRNYVRYGHGTKYWQYHCRPLYSEDTIFTDQKSDIKFQILHEFKLLYTDDFQLLVVLAIFGFEYCLDLGKPTIETYLKWLEKNDNVSPLKQDIN